MGARALAAALLAAALAACVGPLRRDGAEAPRPDDLRERLAALAEAGGPPTHLAFVTIAGLEPAHYGVAGAPGAAPAAPTVALLAEHGVAAELVEPVAPPAAYPAHASLVTGRPPREHGIVADQRLGERGVRRERASHASLLKAPALWQLAAARRLPVAALDWPTTEGAGIEALLPDVVPTRRGERWATLAEAGATPALAARLREASTAEDGDALARPGPERDALIVSLACELVRAPRPPALLLLRLAGPESPLRDAGPASRAARAALAAADAQLARLLACYDEAGLLATSAFAVAGDRVLHPVHTAIRPNALLAQARLVTLDLRGDVGSWSAIARSNGGSAFVYARDEQRALEARGVLDDVARRTGAFRVVTADEMIRLGADPDAWFGLEALPGFTFANDPAPPIQVPSAARAANGRLWEDRPAWPGFVAFGRGVRRGVRIPRMSQLDVAPTLAALLAMPFERVEGRALVGLLTGTAPAPVAAPR
jgi:hypothetical protein